MDAKSSGTSFKDLCWKIVENARSWSQTDGRKVHVTETVRQGGISLDVLV